MTKHLKNRPVAAGLRGPRLAVLAGVLASLAVSVAVPSPGRAEEPLRSGRILAAHADTSGYTWVYPWDGCGGAPECLAWQQSYCNADLAGRDPAMTSSIEAVADLADGKTVRTLDVLPVARGVLDSGRLIVEFWNETCSNILESRAVYRLPCAGMCATFPIPSNARWMTITSKPGNANIEWRLT